MAEKLLCGVDLGGTKLSAGLFTREGDSVAEVKVTDHSELSNDQMVDRISELVRELLDSQALSDSDLRGIGIGMAGHVNSEQGLVITTSNYPVPFRNYRLRDRLLKRFDTPIIVDNDANAQAFGEFIFGAGRGKSNVTFLTISTGVGAGIIINGKLVRGHSGFAGEIGHTIVEPASPIQCTCGNYGCLMALSGTIGMADRYRQHLKNGMISGMDLSPGTITKFDGRDLERGIESGDEISRRLFEESAAYVGIGIYNIYQSINPEILIIGGGLMRVGNGFLEKIRHKFESLVQNMVYEELQIVPAALGNRAGLLGAAALTLEER